MTIVPVFKKCPKCNKKYSWNPDVGRMWCPNCGPFSMPGAGDIAWKRKVEDIFGKKNK